MPKRQKPHSSAGERHRRKGESQRQIADLEERLRHPPPEEEDETFGQLPLSVATLKGLRNSHYVTLTDIQRKSLPLALRGRDILGAAKTGSGKTLAFVTPVLEILYRKNWSQLDGLGALIITPTRELAIQIFKVLRQVGQAHPLSAGLLIGGKTVKDEGERLAKMNILVCTPGRLLQHMDQTAGFYVDNIQMLVLDEADRTMDMGFSKTMDAVVRNLPKLRQTLLFSATQTKRVKDLARLSLHDPEYIAVHEGAQSSTPSKLQQFFVTVPLYEKLDILYGFLRTHLQSKTLVFMSSGKQVRMVFETFRRLHPGIPLLHLHGRQKQGTRIEIVNRFSEAKHTALFATDIAARGLDFPVVDWVVQVDCPEDADTYIHRVGRTARYDREGKALLMLTPSEETGMIKRLEAKKVPLKKIDIRPNKKQSIQSRLQTILFKNPETKLTAQKAFAAYIRSIYLQPDKEVFDPNSIPLAEFATSLGLSSVPHVRYLNNPGKLKALKNAPNISMQKLKMKRFSSQTSNDSSESDSESANVGKENSFLRTTRGMTIGGDSDNDNDDEEDILQIRRTYEPEKAGEEKIPLSKRKEKMACTRKKALKLKPQGRRVRFDEEGEQHEMYEFQDPQKIDIDVEKQAYLHQQTILMQQKDEEDKSLAKIKRQNKKRKLSDNTTRFD